MPFELAEHSLHCRNILGKFLYVKTFFSCCSCRHQTVHDVHADWSKTRWAILDSPQTIENVLVLNFYTINTPLYHNVLILTTVMRRLHRNHLPTKQNDVVSSSPQANMLRPPHHLHSSLSLNKILLHSVRINHSSRYQLGLLQHDVSPKHHRICEEREDRSQKCQTWTVSNRIWIDFFFP